MFSFRRKPRKSQDTTRIRASPSLPELTSQGIPWPENLVDVAAIRQEVPTNVPHQGATKTSFQGIDHTSIPFHKPFRVFSGKDNDGGPISSLYMSTPPSAFGNWKSAGTIPSGRYSQRRARAPPTFNLMVVGGLGTGKTSLLRLLLGTADISPTATVDQQAVMDRFLRGPAKTTQSIQTACIEICESRFDRVLLSVIDTPGLDFLEGRELKLERQVNTVMKYIDSQYADTMSEESKVVRKSKGDQHIHLCIYMIDPSSIMTAAARRAASSLPGKTRSEATISHSTPPDLVPDTSSGDDSDDEDAPLTMSPAEIKVIRRISVRSNILPVIAHADSLTDERLLAVKNAIRTGLADAGIDFGVFGSAKLPSETPERRTHFTPSNGDANEEHSDEEERQARPIIKLRQTRHAVGRQLSRSRSRRDLTLAADDEHRPISPDPADKESVANVRFSAHIVAKTDLAALMPFALIAPEGGRARKRPVSTDSRVLNTASTSPVQQSEDGHAPSLATMPSTRDPTYLRGPPDDLRGVFVRKFRWGTIDVLDPDHCDFAALRTAVLSTHLKLLKNHTKEVLYEKYRTQKLLARRATSQIAEEEQRRLLEDLGL